MGVTWLGCWSCYPEVPVQIPSSNPRWIDLNRFKFHVLWFLTSFCSIWHVWLLTIQCYQWAQLVLNTSTLIFFNQLFWFSICDFNFVAHFQLPSLGCVLEICFWSFQALTYKQCYNKVDANEENSEGNHLPYRIAVFSNWYCDSIMSDLCQKCKAIWESPTAFQS